MTDLEQHLGTGAGIIAIVLTTWLTRASGFWLMAHVPLTPRLRAMLAALPGSVVAATVLPIAVKGGTPALLAVAVAGGLMLLRRNELLAVIGGIAAAALARAAGL